MSCFSYEGEDTRRLIALAFCVDPKHPHARSTPSLKPKPHTPTPPLGGTKKERAPTLGDPHSQKNCGSHLLSHTHQDAVPSTPQGLATRFEKETERFPPAITTAKPHNNTFTGITPAKNGLLPQNCTVNTNTQNKYDYNVSLRSISTSQLHTLQRFHTRPINPVIYREPHTPHRGPGELITKQASRLDAFSGYPSRT